MMQNALGQGMLNTLLSNEQSRTIQLNITFMLEHSAYAMAHEAQSINRIQYTGCYVAMDTRSLLVGSRVLRMYCAQPHLCQQPSSDNIGERLHPAGAPLLRSVMCLYK